MILSICTSGNVWREDLISDWCIVSTDSGKIIESYYHRFYGWMIKGEKDGLFIYGYVPLKENIVNWKFK